MAQPVPVRLGGGGPRRGAGGGRRAAPPRVEPWNACPPARTDAEDALLLALRFPAAAAALLRDGTVIGARGREVDDLDLFDL